MSDFSSVTVVLWWEDTRSTDSSSSLHCGRMRKRRSAVTRGSVAPHIELSVNNDCWLCDFVRTPAARRPLLSPPRTFKVTRNCLFLPPTQASAKTKLYYFRAASSESVSQWPPPPPPPPWCAREYDGPISLSLSPLSDRAAPSHEYSTHQQKQKRQPLPTQNETLMLHLPVFFCPIDWVYAQIHLGTAASPSRSSSASNIIR